MSIGAVIIAILLLICICLVVSELSYSIKHKNRINRKEHDHRVFNPIREKAWWRK